MLAVLRILVVPANTLTHCALALLIPAWDYHRKIPLAIDIELNTQHSLKKMIPNTVEHHFTFSKNDVMTWKA